MCLFRSGAYSAPICSFLLGCGFTAGTVHFDEPPTFSVDGRIFIRPGITLDNAEVTVLDHDLVATSDAEGYFSLSEVPGTATFSVRAEGYVQTLSAWRSVQQDDPNMELAAVKQDYFDVLHLVGGVDPNPETGVVIAAAVNEATLPISGATLRLEPRGETTGTSSSRPYYASYIAGTGLLYFNPDSAGTQERVGVAVFFDVLPGSYDLIVSRPGITFPDVSLTVLPGAATSDIIYGTGTEGTVPTILSGNIQAAPRYPKIAAVSPLEGASVVLYAGPGEPTYQTTTDASGDFQFELPFAHRSIDITLSKMGYGVLRTNMFWVEAMTKNHWRFTIVDPITQWPGLLRASGGQTLTPGNGTIRAWVTDYIEGEWKTIPGAELFSEPPLPNVYYGDTGPQGCSLQLCGDSGASCPAGSRCEAGECLLGESAPLCSRRLAAGCEEGYVPVWLSNPANYNGYHCLPEQVDCFTPDPPCPDGTYCRADLSWDQIDNLGMVQSKYCQPYGQLEAATSSTYGNQAVLTNVPPGEYTIHAVVDGKSVEPIRIRMGDGVVILASFNVK